jgi:hypothetical protein
MTSPTLQAFHRYILGDVYNWAGELRTVSIAKGSVFCLPQHLESYAADVFGRLAAADRLRGLARDPFITALAGGRPAVQRVRRRSARRLPDLTDPGHSKQDRGRPRGTSAPLPSRTRDKNPPPPPAITTTARADHPFQRGPP